MTFSLLGECMCLRGECIVVVFFDQVNVMIFLYQLNVIIQIWDLEPSRQPPHLQQNSPLDTVMASAHYQNCLILKVTTELLLSNTQGRGERKRGGGHKIMQFGQKSTVIPKGKVQKLP